MAKNMTTAFTLQPNGLTEAAGAIEDIVAVVAHSKANGSSAWWEVESCGNFSADDLPSSFFLSREGNQEYLVRK